jgi:hypothetical protein
VEWERDREGILDREEESLEGCPRKGNQGRANRREAESDGTKEEGKGVVGEGDGTANAAPGTAT